MKNRINVSAITMAAIFLSSNSLYCMKKTKNLDNYLEQRFVGKKGKKQIDLQLIFTAQPHKSKILSISYSPSDEYIITSAEKDNNVVLSDPHTGKKIMNLRVGCTFDDKLANSELSCEHRNNYIGATTNDGLVMMFDAKTGETIKTFDNGTLGCGHARFSLNGRYLITHTTNSVATLRDLESNKIIHTFKDIGENVKNPKQRKVQFSPCSNYIAEKGDGLPFNIWKIGNKNDKGKVDKTYTFDDQIEGLEFSPCGNYILTNSKDGTIRLCDAFSYKQIRKLTDKDSTIWGITYGLGDRTIFTIHRDFTARAWDTNSFEQVYSIKLSKSSYMTYPLWCNYIAVLDIKNNKSTIKIVDVKTGDPLYTAYEEGEIYNCGISSCMNYFVVGFDSGTIKVWRIKEKAHFVEQQKSTDFDLNLNYL